MKPQYISLAVFVDVWWVCPVCFQEEESLMNFHISNLEFACGDTLRNVSALHWDQNEDYPQFSGENLVLPGGISQVLSKLAEGLDIELDTKVICFKISPFVTEKSSFKIYKKNLTDILHDFDFKSWF